MGLKTNFDPAALIARMEQLGARAEKRGAEVLRKAANEVKDRAKAYAPLEHGGLEEAIEVYSDHSGINRRRVYYVAVDPDAPELDKEGKPTGRTVGRYATEMHEGVYNPGKRSQEKANALGVVVGPKYLERAADEVGAEILQAVASRIREVF